MFIIYVIRSSIDEIPLSHFNTSPGMQSYFGIFPKRNHLHDVLSLYFIFSN